VPQHSRQIPVHFSVRHINRLVTIDWSPLVAVDTQSLELSHTHVIANASPAATEAGQCIIYSMQMAHASTLLIWTISLASILCMLLRPRRIAEAYWVCRGRDAPNPHPFDSVAAGNACRV
jgi:hypothetical protein